MAEAKGMVEGWAEVGLEAGARVAVVQVLEVTVEQTA